MQKRISTLSGIIVIIAAAVIFMGGALVYQYFIAHNVSNGVEVSNMPLNQSQQKVINKQGQTVSRPQNSTQAVNINGADVKESWKTFKDNGFQMQYPSNASIMSAPTARTVPCNNSCPSTMTVNGIESTMANITINGVNYCVYSGATVKADHTYYNELLYLTVSNNACYGLDFSYTDDNCGNYTTPATIASCKSEETTKQTSISTAVSTITFKK